MTSPSIQNTNFVASVSDAGVREVVATWGTGIAFLADYEDRGAGRILLRLPPESQPPEIGERVSVRIRIEERDIEVCAFCNVVERKAEPVGWLVEFANGQERRRQLVVACARGESVPYARRRAIRVPIFLSVTMNDGEGPSRRVRSVNLSNEGMRLAVPQPVPMEARVALRVWTLGLLWAWPQRLSGRVTACEEVDGGFEIGVNLYFGSHAERRYWGRVVAAALAQYR